LPGCNLIYICGDFKNKNRAEMRIENNKMVSLIYELRERDSEGRIIETLDEKRPLTFVYGTGRLLPFFESNINALGTGDAFAFTLKSEMAYGERREDMIIDVPVSIFETDGKIDEDICRVGNEVPMMDTEGNPLNGVINEITDTHVKMDFNHPMAGLDLFFAGKIVDVREATESELTGSMNSCSGCSSDPNSGCGGNCG
jgi:FKBP-type peptidyl-prolyl cis-trans isomerase SlyD